ncbi:MAG: hypothetical protein ACWGN2_11805 [Anaerolineales bacterium]
MTIKTVTRDTCPDPWYIGCQCRMAGEVLELVEIEGDQYTWMDVEILDPTRWIINEMDKKERHLPLQAMANCKTI